MQPIIGVKIIGASVVGGMLLLSGVSIGFRPSSEGLVGSFSLFPNIEPAGLLLASVTVGASGDVGVETGVLSGVGEDSGVEKMSGVGVGTWNRVDGKVGAICWLT